MKLTLGFSPCPNDTFIFDALVNNKINTEGLRFEVQLEDVQTLNEWALNGKTDISKISYGVLPLVLNEYIVLTAGGAMGKGVGPLLISKPGAKGIDALNKMNVAIPGKNTTAHMLFCQAFPKAQLKKFMIFSSIEEAVISGEVEAGVIIHENRFTYQQKGLVKMIDLGEYWEKATGNPIPLGGIVMKRKFDTHLQQQINRLIKKSLEFAFDNYPAVTDYVKEHSQEMDEQVMRQHIDLYVNEFSLNLGENGKNAVNELLRIYQDTNHTSIPDQPVFVG